MIAPATPLKLILPVPPPVNHYWRIFRNRMILSEDARKYKVAVGIIARRSGIRPIDGAIRIAIDVYRARKAGDLDNFLKGILDGLKGSMFHDDKQVVEIQARRFDDKVNPRVEVQAFEMQKGKLF